MTEIIVTVLTTSIRWYEGHGFRVEKLDVANGFALLNDSHDGRLALKTGTPNPGTMLLHFEVKELPTGDVKVSEEGYRRVLLSDPDGYRICIFSFATHDHHRS